VPFLRLCFLFPSHVSSLLLSFLFYCYAAPRDLHSFPTRRSSDLRASRAVVEASHPDSSQFTPFASGPPKASVPNRTFSGYHSSRSEEHTSELQSRVDLVCRLLLEKKKKQKTNCITKQVFNLYSAS